MSRSADRMVAAGIAAFSLVVPMAFALIQDFTLSEGLNDFGTIIVDILGNDNARYGLLVVFGIVFFRALFIAGLKRVPAFQGEGAHGVSTSGRIIATSLGFMVVIGIASQAERIGLLRKLGEMEGTSAVLLTFLVAGFYLFSAIKNSKSHSWKAPAFWTMIIFLVGALVFSNLLLWIMTVTLLIIWIVMISESWGGGPGTGSPYVHQRGPPKQRLKRLIDWSKQFRKTLREKLDVLRDESSFIAGETQDIQQEQKGLTLAAQHHHYIFELQKEKKIGLDQVIQEIKSPQATDFKSLHEKFQKLYALVMHQLQSLNRITQVTDAEHQKERKFIKENHTIMNHLEKIVSQEVAEDIENTDERQLLKLHAIKKRKRQEAVHNSKQAISKVMHIKHIESSMQSIINRELKIYRNLYNDMNKIIQRGQPAEHITDKLEKLKKLEAELGRYEEVTVTNLLSEVNSLQQEKGKLVSLIGRLNEKIYSLEQKEAEEVKKEVEEAKREDETEVEADKLD